MKQTENKQANSSKLDQLKEDVLSIVSKYKKVTAFAGGYLTEITDETALRIEEDLRALFQGK